tara:strand:- start:570 stop:686 length:117 start_codon:yes stop_codon:yes gene_type:complete
VSPLELYQLPYSMFKELLFIHITMKELEAEEIQKKMKG